MNILLTLLALTLINLKKYIKDQNQDYYFRVNLGHFCSNYNFFETPNGCISNCQNKLGLWKKAYFLVFFRHIVSFCLSRIP